MICRKYISKYLCENVRKLCSPVQKAYIIMWNLHIHTCKWSYCNAFATLTEGKGNQHYCNMFATLTEGQVTKAMHIPLVVAHVCHSNWRKSNQSYCNTFATLTMINQQKSFQIKSETLCPQEDNKIYNWDVVWAYKESKFTKLDDLQYWTHSKLDSFTPRLIQSSTHYLFIHLMLDLFVHVMLDSFCLLDMGLFPFVWCWTLSICSILDSFHSFNAGLFSFKAGCFLV